MPQFSVIIPTYNRYKYTKRAINSVLNQTFTDYELILINDGSTDNTSILEDEFRGRIKYIYQKNKGVSHARNTGIKISKSPILTFLDSDDEWLPLKLEKQFQFIKDNPSVKIHQTDDIWIRNGKRVNPANKHLKIDGNIFTQSLELCLISPSAVAIESSLLDLYGLFDEEMPACEDYDLWLRITLNESVGLVPEKLIIRYGGHNDQLSKAYWGMDRFRIYSICKLLKENNDTMKIEDIEKAKSIALGKLKILQGGAAKRGNTEFANSVKAISDSLVHECYNNIDYQILVKE